MLEPPALPASALYVMWIVDWDEVILAPKECDLMFVVGGIGRGSVLASVEWVRGV